jgi:hypothetical protein
MKRSRDLGLDHVKRAPSNKENPLSKLELDFVRTSCHILDINSEDTIKSIVKRAKEKGGYQPKRVIAYIRAQLEDLGTRAENHKRPTLTPDLATRMYNSMGAPARSLAHLQLCARGLRAAIEGEFSRGIKMARIATDNAIVDFKATIARVQEASKWKRGVADSWYAKGEEICEDLIEEAAEALKRADAREEAEAKIRIMEDQCDELADLTEQAGKQIPAEAETELLIDLEEEMEQRKDTVEDLGRALKETVPAGLKERVEQAIQDSVKLVEKGKRYLDHVRARLEFISADSESGSYKGPTGKGAAPSQWRTAAEELGDEEEVAETSRAGPESLANVLRGWGQLKANDSGWPTFDSRYASYPRFKREWIAYRETYHSVVNNDLAAKALRDKCIKGDALRMVSHLDDLQEIWDTLDTCFERPEKYMEEVLRPIVEFKKYRATDSSAVREFYSLLRVAIKGAKGIRRQGLLVNDQTIPRIMGKMPYTDWKEWATRRPEWKRGDLGSAFEGFVERKWQDTLNVAAAEPLSWRTEKEKTTSGKVAMDKAPHVHKGAGKASGAVNVVSQQSPPRSHSPSWDISSGRRCRAQFLIGCDGDHVVLQCAKLECFGQGGFSKPKCMRPGCGGEHAVGAHRLQGESDACVNLTTGGNHESEEEEEWWVNTVRAGEEEEDLEEVGDSEPEENREREVRYFTSTCMRKDDSGLEDELEYFWEVPITSDSDEREEDRWWSPGPQEPSSEEDEEEV